MDIVRGTPTAEALVILGILLAKFRIPTDVGLDIVFQMKASNNIVQGMPQYVNRLFDQTLIVGNDMRGQPTIVIVDSSLARQTAHHEGANCMNCLFRPTIGTTTKALTMRLGQNVFGGNLCSAIGNEFQKGPVQSTATRNCLDTWTILDLAFQGVVCCRGSIRRFSSHVNSK